MTKSQIELQIEDLKRKFHKGEGDIEEIIWELDRLNPDANIGRRYLDGEDLFSLVQSA